MPKWLQKLTKRIDESSEPMTSRAGMAVAEPRAASFRRESEPAPEFSTKLAVESPGAPGMAGAESLYRKWADKWQEF